MKIPQTIQDEVKKLESPLSMIPGEFDKVILKLRAIAFKYIPNPISQTAQVAILVRQNIDKFLMQAGIMICIHPWTSGAAEFGEGKYTEQLNGYLSKAKAATHLLKKFSDPEDAAKDDVNAAFCIAISSDNLNAWIEKLSILNEFYPFPGSVFCEKRAAALSKINSSKMLKKNTAENPYWANYQITSEYTAEEVKKITDELTGIVEVFALDKNPIDELISVIEEEKEIIEEAVRAWQILIDKISGGEINHYYAVGATPYTVGMQIASQMMLDNSKYCCLVVLAGKKENIDFFKEAFEKDDSISTRE